MRVSELFNQAGVAYQGAPDTKFRSLSADSRNIEPGDLFVCMESESGDTHRFIDAAVARGAVGAIVHSTVALGANRYLPQGSFDQAIWRLSKVAFGDPSQAMRVIGITGTNGKTTTAWILRDALEASGRTAAYIGTLGFKDRNGLQKGLNTTPFAVDLNQQMRHAVDSRTQDLVMEVSSHALSQHRVDGIKFELALFTNLTQDHLDFHGSMAEYGQAKSRLFLDMGVPKAVINVGDPFGASLAAQINAPVTFSLGDVGTVQGSVVEVGATNLVMRVRIEDKSIDVRVPLGGLFNVNNALAAFTVLVTLGQTPTSAAESLAHVTAAPGRFEAVPNDLGISVVVDFAHTPDALARMMDAARALQPRRVIAVFGCGGDRDRTKRPLMAKEVGERADLTVLTSDNPRTEDPMQILNDAAAGLPAGANYLKIVDRKSAVIEAVRQAEPGDIVLLAGKGHEDYQIIGTTKYPMDDRQLAREALEARS